MFVSASTVLKFHNIIDQTSALTYQSLGAGNIGSLSLSKDDWFLAFVAENGMPEIISLKDPGKIKNVHTISSVNEVSALTFERSTKRLIGLATHSGQVALYDTKTKSIGKLFQSAPCEVTLLDFNHGDKQMAVAGTNGSVLLYDTTKTDIFETYFLSNSCCATTMRFHPTERQLLVVGAEDGTLIQWDIDAGQHLFTIQAHTAPITGAVSVRNSHFLASVSYDYKFSVCDARMGTSAFRNNLQHPLTAIDASPDGLTIAIGALFGDLYRYDIRNLILPLAMERPHDTRINEILFGHQVMDDFTEIVAEGETETCYAGGEIPLNDTVNFKEYAVVPPNTKVDVEDTTWGSEPSCLPNVTKGDKLAFVKCMKKQVADAIRSSAEEIKFNLTSQLDSLQGIVANEFRNIDTELDEKWDLQNLTFLLSELTTGKLEAD